MTSPRMPLFQKKGGDSAAPMGGKPSVVIAIGHSKPGNDTGSAESADTDEGQAVTCPQCGCTFDPDTGKVMEGDKGGQGNQPPDAGGDLNAKIASMMQGAPNGQ